MPAAPTGEYLWVYEEIPSNYIPLSNQWPAFKCESPTPSIKTTCIQLTSRQNSTATAFKCEPPATTLYNLDECNRFPPKLNWMQVRSTIMHGSFAPTTGANYPRINLKYVMPAAPTGEYIWIWGNTFQLHPIIQSVTSIQMWVTYPLNSNHLHPTDFPPKLNCTAFKCEPAATTLFNPHECNWLPAKTQPNAV